VHGQVRGRELEDQPPAASVDVRLAKDVCEEGPIRFRITTEQDDMAAVDHTRRLPAVLDKVTTVAAT
jgi:hypothetical protein